MNETEPITADELALWRKLADSELFATYLSWYDLTEIEYVVLSAFPRLLAEIDQQRLAASTAACETP